MLKFGSANIFSGNIGEQALKEIVKDHAEKTQRRPDKFEEQCAIREYESNVIKYVMTDISSQIGVSTHSSKSNNEMWESRGRYTIHFCKTNNRGVGIGEDMVLWHDSKREKMQYTCCMWAGGTFFPVVVLSQFLVLVGNRFWFYILMYLQYNTVVVLC